MERVPEWTYPWRNDVIAEMRTYGHIVALESAFFQPIHNLPWRLEPGDLPPDAAAKLAEDLDLPIGQADDDSTRRYQVGFHQLLDYALTYALYGHAVCEIVGDTDMDPGWWRIKRFAPIEQETINPGKWMVEPDGTLQSLGVDLLGPEPVVLDAVRVQRWAYKPRQGDPVGRSMLRPLYMHWLCNQELYRVDQVRHNKSANGTWVVTGKEGDDHDTIEELTDAFSQTIVDELAAIGLQQGQTAENVGITGAVTDPLQSIKHHEEAMSRAWSEQVVQLGSTESGSRALGEVHEDIAASARIAVAADIAEEFNRQSVSRWTEFNDYRGLVKRPRVTCDKPKPATPIVVNTPPPAQPSVDEPADVVAASRGCTCGTDHVAAARAAPDGGKVPGVPQATRQLRAAERSTNFAEIHGDWEDAVAEVTTAYRAVRGEQLKAAIEVVATANTVLGALETLREDARAAALDAVPQAQLEAVSSVLESTAQQAAGTVAADAREAGTRVQEANVEYATAASTAATLASQQIATTVAEEVTNRTQALASEAADPAAVAAAVKDQIDTQLTDAQLTQIAGADTTRAQTAGRQTQTRASESQIRDIYASSVLDGNTCSACADLDGTQYDSVDEAEQDFPTGGYAGCEGGDRCRCLYVVTWESEQALAVDDRGTA
ncbi:phage portal protein family protein [Patulibacter minatonensis]|uniref:phage portal protein family protein n=1 Tax=Patulibacter minatonensis TaxID=298163 RepID=UPI0012F80829|nr:hypothetical protein [Patulibacter minatonensis]